MKKLICVVLAVMLALSVVSAFAEADILITVDDLTSERWFDLNSDTIFVFENGGGYIQTYGTSYTGGQWAINGNEVSLSRVLLHAEPSEYGVTLAGGEYALIKESAYPVLTAEIGGSLSDENISAKINAVEFIDDWPDELKANLRGNVDQSTLSEGQCVAKITFQIMNLTKKDIPLSEGYFGHFQMAIDYRDGFVFTTDGPTLFFITDESSWRFHNTDRNGMNLGVVSVAPLEEKTVTLYLACSKVLKDDTESPLKVLIYETINGRLNILQFPMR